VFYKDTKITEKWEKSGLSKCPGNLRKPAFKQISAYISLQVLRINYGA
jgi:hypothetical protein